MQLLDRIGKKTKKMESAEGHQGGYSVRVAMTYAEFVCITWLKPRAKSPQSDPLTCLTLGVRQHCQSWQCNPYDMCVYGVWYTVGRAVAGGGGGGELLDLRNGGLSWESVRRRNIERTLLVKAEVPI